MFQTPGEVHRVAPLVRLWLGYRTNPNQGIQAVQPLTIDYFSPHSREHTSGTIHVDEIYDSNDHIYIDACCHQAEKVLTFRLDRVLRIHAPSSVQDVAV